MRIRAHSPPHPAILPSMGATSEHFTDAELRCPGTNCGPDKKGCHQNNCTPILVNGLELLRAKAGQLWMEKHGAAKAYDFPGVRIHDAYRCVFHNAGTTGAAQDSQHPNGRAADLSVEGLTAAELEAIADQIPSFKGIGRDDIRNMLHVDVRPASFVARWCYYRNEQTGGIKWGPYYHPGEAPISA